MKWNLQSRSSLAVIALSLICRAETPDSRYSTAARNYAEALLKYGPDHYGAVHTPLWVQILDLRTLEIPRQNTAAEWRAEMSSWKEDNNYLMWGKDRSSMAWAHDSNLLWDTESIRLFLAISRDSGDRRFAVAADEYMKYFLRHCVSRTTGLFAWGEHVAYNVLDDQIKGRRHELQHTNPLWDELWRIDPDRVRNEIEALYAYHVTDKRMMAYDRHANFWNGLPERDQATIMGYAGTFITSWAWLYKQTGDPRYKEWARRQLLAFQSKEDEGLWPDNWTDSQKRELPLSYPIRPELAEALYKAYDLTADKAWLDDADRYLEACNRRMDVRALDATGLPMFARAGFAEAAVRRYRSTGNRASLDKASQVAQSLIEREQPRTQMASHVAEQLNFLMSLYDATSETRWLDGARKIADRAITTFIHPSGLIRGTAVVNRPGYYDAIQGPGMLALALYRLGQSKSPPRPADAGTLPRPKIVITSFPQVSSNLDPATVTARLSSPAGIRKAVLHYAYGNDVGFSDASPTISSGTYTFHIAPPGMTFIGEVAFAVEAIDQNGNRALTPWQHLKLCLRDPGEPPVETIRWLPDGVHPPEQGWRSIGRYFKIGLNSKAQRFSIQYTTEETWRLIESTLSLAYWDGRAWLRVPSRIDSANRVVSTEVRRAAYWTLLGEDRVLWRANGRETGPALADLDGDGKLEVLTTFFQPGELLSASGLPLKRFSIDSPYRPINNSSSPAIARLAPGAAPTLLFVAPSGYLYAYEASGALRWRTEVGGEALGGPAVGALLPGGITGVAVAWGGGMSVVDQNGRRVWQRELPVPSASSPVLVDLDGDGQLDIVVNAGERLIALRGDTGRTRWEYTSPGVEFTVPAAGEFARDARPRIVAGDDQGVIYALDERGKLLWRQDRIFGPREVPEPVEHYAGISEVGLADLNGSGLREVVVTTRSGETVALSAQGERLWRFASYERKVGISLGGGARLAFADLDNDGKLEVILSQQDSFVYVLGADGRLKWTFLGYFWYHSPLAIGDLQGNGELNIVFTCPENLGTYALRSGVRGVPGRNPWPMMRGGLTRTNCAPWRE